MSLYVWGVDVGTKRSAIARAALDGPDVRVNLMEVHEADPQTSLDKWYTDVRQFACALADHQPPVVVFVETPTGAHPEPELVATYGVIRLALHHALRIEDIPIATISVGEWKRRALGDGNGNASKDKIRAWGKAAWPALAQLTGQDEWDALGVAVGGRHRLRELNPSMRDAA